MAYEFKKLSEVAVVETAMDTANVLIEEEGVIKRMPKSEVGGAKEVSWNDLTDKPFGVKTEMVEIVPQQSVTEEVPEGAGAIFNGTFESNVVIETGKEYTLSINGENIKTTAKEVEDAPPGMQFAILGNIGFVMPEEEKDTGEPVGVLWTGSAYQVYWKADLGETITLAIYEEREVVKQLDPKFVGGGVPLYVDSNNRLYFDKDLTKGITKDEIKDLFINGKNLIIVNGNPAFDGDNYFKITQVVDSYSEDCAEAWTFWAFDSLNVHMSTYYTIEKEVSSGGPPV